jgi:peptidyl-prolyl cis-trans isomerase D
MEVKTSDWITRDGGDGLLAHPRVLAAAFSGEVLDEGLNSELIEPERDALQAVVLRVLEHEEAAPRPLDAVRDEVIESLRDERAAAAAKAAADALLERLAAEGGGLASASDDYELVESGVIGRDEGGVPAAVRELAFSLPRPGAGAGPSLGTLSLDDGDAAVVSVSRADDGELESLSEAERAQAEQALERVHGTSYYEALVADLEQRADISRRAAEGD